MPNIAASSQEAEKPLEDALHYYDKTGGVSELVRATHAVSGKRITRFGTDCEDGMRINERHLESSRNRS